MPHGNLNHPQGEIGKSTGLCGCTLPFKGKLIKMSFPGIWFIRAFLQWQAVSCLLPLFSHAVSFINNLYQLFIQNTAWIPPKPIEATIWHLPQLEPHVNFQQAHWPHLVLCSHTREDWLFSLPAVCLLPPDFHLAASWLQCYFLPGTCKVLHNPRNREDQHLLPLQSRFWFCSCNGMP